MPQWKGGLQNLVVALEVVAYKTPRRDAPQKPLEQFETAQTLMTQWKDRKQDLEKPLALVCEPYSCETLLQRWLTLLVVMKAWYRVPRQDLRDKQKVPVNKDSLHLRFFAEY